MPLPEVNTIPFLPQQSAVCSSDAPNASLPLRLAQPAVILLRVARFDRQYFADKIKASRFGSQRQLAPHLKQLNGDSLDQSNVSRLLSGKRHMLLHEAQQLARLLDVPLTEVLEHAGLKLNSQAMSPAEFAKRVRKARGSAQDVVADLLRSLGYGEGVEALDGREKGKTG